ncbi:MAG: universal stress protein [Acidobacteriota bacterium]
MTTTPRKLERIVVGTSLTEASDAVVQSALALQRATGARLALVHAFPLPVVYGGGIYGGAAVTQQIDSDRRRYLLLVDAQLERLGATREVFDEIRIEVAIGYRLLDDVAEELGADLVVVGSHEGPKAFEPLLGSTADRLLRRSRRPVLVVRQALDAIRRVALPVDLSPLSETSARLGLGLVDAFAGDAAYSVGATFVLSRAEREGSVHFEPEQVDRFAQEELDSFVARLEHSGIEATLLCGDPKQEILDHLSAQEDVDLVILGTHGRSGFERFLLGSVSSELLRRLEHTALVVPPASYDADQAAAESDDAGD